jgi:hypothetical protein
MSIYRNLAVLCLFILSCAPQDKEKYALLGRWEMERMDCYANGIRPGVTPTEVFTPNQGEIYRLSAIGKDVQLLASSVNGNCSYEVSGRYLIESRSNENQGTVEFDIPFVNANGCQLVGQTFINSSQSSVAENLVVELDLASYRGRYFFSNATRLRLQLPINYNGSVTGCSGACQGCLAIFKPF